MYKIKRLKNKYNRRKQETGGIVKELKQLKEACKKEIKSFRNELHSFLDNLEKNMLAELDKWERDESRRIEQNVSALATAFSMLEPDCMLLDHTKRDGRKEMMYTVGVQLSKSLQEYESRLYEFENDAGKPTLTFEKNKMLADLKCEVKSLGSLKPGVKLDSNDNASMMTCNRDNTLFLNRDIQTRCQANVEAVGDEEIPQIIGCTVMANGYAVLCDCNNQKIKLLDSTEDLSANLQLSSSPWDVSVVDSRSIIVTYPDKMQLQFIQVFPQMKSERVIQMDKKCWGVEVSGDDIYVTCHNNPGEGEVRVLGLDGKVNRRLGAHKKGSFMFTQPHGIAVNTSGEKIFVSDCGTHTVTCMSADGHVIYTYKDDGMRQPMRLLCDSGDNVLVCDCSNVQVVTADGKKDRTLLSHKDGLRFPWCIAYRASDDYLLVGCASMNNILSFQLTK